MKLEAPRLNAPMLEWALWWAGRGWPVFPVWWPVNGQDCGCGQNHKDSGKHPISKCAPNGFQDGTADPQQIREWWSRYPNANIGGTPPAGMVAIDIDGPLDEGLVFPETQTHGSGKGQHLVYVNNLAQPLEQTQTANRYWTNVDTRVSGRGYLVLPPSVHQNGTRYELLNAMQPIEFPDSMVPARKKTTSKRALSETDSEIVKLLTMDRAAPELGDDAMAKVAGWLARYAPDKEHFDALLWAINAGLAEPLHPTALAKKRGIWDKHQETLAAKESKAVDDEAKGWLFELGDTGYSTALENRDSVEYVPWSDFRVTARGLIILPDQQVWIVDFQRADGSTLEGQRLSSKVLAFPGRLRSWLLDRGMVLYDNRQDKRSAHGARLVKLMQSQDPPVWKSRDYYGWCEETKGFLTPLGEVTFEGIRQFSGVYPEDELTHSSPVVYRFEADLDTARDWFKRVLRLQDETETAKIGAWLMMLWLRGQWRGILPGILVEASAGVGKTLWFQLFSKLAGSTNDGEQMTIATARDMLAGNSSGFVWFDDVAMPTQLEELVRKAVTQGKVTLKTKTEDAGWRNTYKQLRGSIVITGEGTDFFRQKAQRDRFIDVEFTNKNRSSDAVALQHEDIGRGSGVLLQECLRHADKLALLADLMEGVTDRDRQAQTALRVGARILDAVMGTDQHYTTLIDGWFMGKAVELDKGQASEVVLHVLPTLWASLGHPKSPGDNGLALPVWFDEVDQCFWVSGIKVAEYWNNRRNVNERQRQLTSQANIRRELDACGASEAASKRIPGATEKGTTKYRKLNQKYSGLILQAAEVHTEED